MSIRSKGKSTRTTTAVAPVQGFSLISNEKLLALYASLVRCRIDGRLRGYEAALVAPVIDLGAGDTLVAPGSLVSERMVKEVFPGSTFRMFPFAAARNGIHSPAPGKVKSPPLSQDQLHSVLGASLAARTRKDGAITVLFCRGEPSGAWHDGLQIAVTHGLPIVFVNQARRRAHSARRGRPAAKDRPPTDSSLPYLPSIPVDANDLVAIYRVASEGINRARKGRGPTLIECVPVHGALRGGGSASTDAVRAMENYLRSKNLVTSQIKRGAYFLAASPR